MYTITDWLRHIHDAIQTLGKNVTVSHQADWAEDDPTSASFIKNKAGADWEESDDSSPSYIENKPMIPTPIILSGVPTSDISSPSEVHELGFTDIEVRAAARGYRTGVVIENGLLGNTFYKIDSCETSNKSFTISFSRVVYELDSNDQFVASSSSEYCVITVNNLDATCITNIVGQPSGGGIIPGGGGITPIINP